MGDETCFRCMRSGRIVKLLDAVYGNEISKICEECALIEDIPIIRKPSSFQLEAASKPYSVSERLRRMSGVSQKANITEIKSIRKEERISGLTLDKLRQPKDYSEILKRREERAKKRNQPLDLVANYNWIMQRARRSRKMTVSQLGGIIGETDSNIKMIEDGFLPDDADRIIKKIEQFFKINLRNSGAAQEQIRIERVKQPARILSFNPKSLNELTIHDLKAIKEQREKLSQEEADKEIASKIVWQGKSKEAREKDKQEENKETRAEEQIKQETGEEKKSKRSFWDIFKKKKDDDIEEESVVIGDDISEIDEK